MPTRSRIRNAVRAVVLTGSAFVLMGASGCDLIYRYVQCILSGECTELVPELFSFPPEPPPPPPPSRDHATPAASANGSEFGAALAAPSSSVTSAQSVRLVVGAPGDQTDAGTTGAAYIYMGPYDEAAEPARLVPSDATPGARFGAAVAVERFGSETVVLVGAPGAYPSGAVYVFEWNGSAWTEVATFRPEGSDFYSEFGAAVACVKPGSGDDRIAVVGAPYSSGGGQVHVYRRGAATAWAADTADGHVATFRSSDIATDDRFGASLAAAGSYLAVGAPGRGGYMGSGAAYLFQYVAGTGVWTESPTRMEPEGSPSQAAFGRSVAVTTATGATTPTVLVGAPGGGYTEEEGVVWAFRRSTDGTLVRRRFASAGPGYGGVVATDPVNAAVAVGSPDGSSDPTFAAHVYAPAPFDRAGQTGRPVRGDGPWESYHDFGEAIVVRIEIPSGIAVIDVGAPREGDGGRVYHYRLPEGTSDSKAAAPKPEPNRYMAFRADAANPGAGTSQVLVDLPLRPPFRAEVTVGSMNASRRDGLLGGSVSFRLDKQGGDPPSYVLLRARFVENGLEVSADSEYGPGMKVLAMPSEWAADLAIECDGSQIQLWARPRGVGDFSFVTNLSAGAEPWRASIVIEGIAAGSEVGMDEPRVVANAAPAPDTPPHATAVDRIYAVIDREMAASAAIDERELAAALALADEAKSKIAEARAAVALVPAKQATTGPKAALRHLSTAARELASARTLIKRKKRNPQIVARLSKSLAAAGRALVALRT